MRYFWGVGEFWRVKSKPRGTFRSKIGAAAAKAPKRRKSRRWTREHMLCLRQWRPPRFAGSPRLSRAQSAPADTCAIPSRTTKAYRRLVEPAKLVRAKTDLEATPLVGRGNTNSRPQRDILRRHCGEGKLGFPSPLHVFKPQNANFKPNWISRGLFRRELTTPKLPAPKAVPGAANWGRLKRLKNSVRNSRFMFSLGPK